MRGLHALRHGLSGPLHRHRGCDGARGLGRIARSTLASFVIDELRCIYCGMCEEACPVDAIELTKLYDITGLSREEMIFDKEKLLSVFDVTKDSEPMRTGNPAAGVPSGERQTQGKPIVFPRDDEGTTGS